MNSTNSTYSMLATHVNDLRRMWFQEHEKNKKLREKLREFKNLMKNIQSHILNESFTEESNLSLMEIREFSNQSTFEQTSSPNIFQLQLGKVVSNLFMKVMRESFNSIRSSKMLKEKNRLLVFLLNLQQVFQKHEILNKSHAVRLLRSSFRRSSILKLFHSTSGLFFRLKRFSFEKFKQRTLIMNSIDSEFQSNKKILGVNETSPPNFKDYFGKLEKSSEDFKSFSDSCFGGFEQAKNKLNFNFNLEKNKKIIKNPKFLNFLQIFREKIIEKKNFAFQAVLFLFENSICYQEGVKLLVEVLQKVLKRNSKRFALHVIEKRCRVKKVTFKVFAFVLTRVAMRGVQVYFKDLTGFKKSKVSNFTSHVFRRLETILKKPFKKSFNNWKKPQKKFFFNSFLFTSYISLYQLLEFPKKYTTRLKREAFLKMIQTINQELSLTCIQLSTLSTTTQLLKIFNMRKLFKSFETWKKLHKRSKLSPTRSKKLVKLLADSALQKISIAFRSWQYSIYTLMVFTERNKENYCKKLNFEGMSQPRPASQPLRVLRKANL